MRFIKIVHFLAKASYRIAGIAVGMGIVDAEEDFLHGDVVVDEAFEADQLGYEEAHLVLIFCRCQKEQDRVQVALFRDDAISPKVRRQNIGMDSEIFIFARFGIDAGCRK